ncbi:MAG: helix-turn-helix domain-containing protein [Acidimicrobiia bacterium]
MSPSQRRLRTQPDTLSDPDAEVLTLMEAATLLRIGRTTAYELAQEYLDTGGTSGLPVIRVGRQLRVTRTSLNNVMARGTNQRTRPQRRPDRRGAETHEAADPPPRLFN